MKTRTPFLNPIFITVFAIFSSVALQAQSPVIQAVFFGDRIVNKGDTIQLVLSDYRGQLQWQKSFNAKDWTDITGQTNEALSIRIDTNLYFRVKIKEENCDAVFSQTTSFSPVLLTGHAVIIDPEKVILKSDSSDLSNGVYRYDVTADPAITTGDVIVGQEGQGYIRIVESAVNQGNILTLNTSQGTLEDVIRQFCLNDSLAISMIGPSSKPALNQGVKVPVRITHVEPGVSMESGGGIILNDIKLVDTKVGTADVSAIIHSGSIGFSPTFYRKMTISPGNGMETLSMSAEGRLEFTCEMEVTCSDQFIYTSQSLTLLEAEIGPVLIGAVPMYIILRFDAGCDLNFSDSGTFGMGFASDYMLKLGAGYDKNANPEKWTPLWEVKNNLSAGSPVFDSGSGLTAKLFITPGISTRIASVTGPLLEFEPYLQGEVQINLPNWNYTLVGGIDARLGFAVNIFGFGLTGYNKTFINEWILKEGSGTNPTVTTNEAQSITKSSAIVSGSITSTGGTEILEKGICWGLSPKPNMLNNVVKLGTGSAEFSTTIQGLTENKKYYFRAYARNSSGIGWGAEQSFTAVTQVVLPKVTTSTIKAITRTTATGGGSITSNGGGTVTAKGICWNTSENPTTSNSKTTNGSGSGTFTSYLTGLTAGTLYYVRAYATNSAGTAYGEEKQFTSLSPDLFFTDARDSHEYRKVTIGSQVWMAENLAWLPSVNPSTAGSEILINYYVYGYEGSSVSEAKANNNYKTYGVLYNWPAATVACPSGWHLPTDGEWTTLTNFLGASPGAKLKEAGTAHWLINNTATNSSGFTGLPAGYRDFSGGFFDLTLSASFWSSTEASPFVISRDLTVINSELTRYSTYRGYGNSVRCIKNL